MDEDFKPEETLLRLPINPTYKQFARESDIRYIDALNTTLTRREAALKLGVIERSVYAAINRIKLDAAMKLGTTIDEVDEVIETLSKKAALAGVAPDYDYVHRIPSPFRHKGTTVNYGGDGRIIQKWVKSELDSKQYAETIEAWVNWLTKRVTKKSPLIKPPKLSDPDLMCVYPIGDPHFGMYAWAKESGENFSLQKAELITTSAVDRLVGSAPNAEKGVMIVLGDLFHSDNESNKTDRSGAALDVDGRMVEVQQVGLRTLVWAVERMLEKHQTVLVRLVRGNHDKRSSMAIAIALDNYFRNNSRVTISLSPAAFWYVQFGKVLIGATHGDTTKPAMLPGIMSQDCRSVWSAVQHCYFYQGHLHHDRVIEENGVTCEIFRTLAPSDAWHFGSGYRSGRDMRCIVHHREYGEVERHRCDISMLNEGLDSPAAMKIIEAHTQERSNARQSMVYQFD